jgi:hypothetical protein
MTTPDPWTPFDPDSLSGSALVRDPRVAGAAAAADRLSRRDQLRALCDEAIGKTLKGSDLAAGVGIGLVSAIPGTPLDEMAFEAFRGSPLGQWAGRVMPGWTPGDDVTRMSQWMHRGVATIQSGPIGAEGDGVREGVGAMGIDPADVARRWREGELNDVDDLFTLDGEDLVGAAAARWMADKWTARRGWTRGDKPYHEFKALSYGVNAIVTAPFNPNPILMGLAAWHLFRAMAASRQLTAHLRELADLAIADGRAAMAAYDAQVATWERWSALGARVAARPILVGEARLIEDDRLRSLFDT